MYISNEFDLSFQHIFTTDGVETFFVWPVGLPKLSPVLSKSSVPGRCTLQFSRKNKYIMSNYITLVTELYVAVFHDKVYTQK